MIKKFMDAIKGKSWHDAKIIAKKMMKKEEHLNPEYDAAIRGAAHIALIRYHAELYGNGLCDQDAVARFLME